MNTPAGVRGLASFVLSAMLAGIAGGCSLLKSHPEQPPVILDVNGKKLVRADGKLLTKCAPPAPSSKVPAAGECVGLRQVDVLDVKSIAVLKTSKNPTCYVYVWEGYYWEWCE